MGYGIELRRQVTQLVADFTQVVKSSQRNDL